MYIMERNRQKYGCQPEFYSFSLGSDEKLEAQREDLEFYVSNCESHLGLEVHPTTRGTYIIQINQLEDSRETDKKFSCELQTSHEEGQKAFTGTVFFKCPLFHLNKS